MKTICINYDEIISAGSEYIDARNAFSRRYPHGIYVTHSNPEAFDLYTLCERAERVLFTVSWVTGISQDVIINVARIENRYYERGGGRCVDAKRLLESLSQPA